MVKISPCNLLKQQLGLLKIDEKGKEVEVYQEAVDLDGDGTEETRIDTDGDKNISCEEVWSFFFYHINRLPPEDVKKVIASIALQVRIYKSAKHAELLGQLAFANYEYVKEYKNILIKANQSDFPDLCLAAIGAMKMFLVAEAAYYHDRPDKVLETDEFDLPPLMPTNPDLCLERPNLPEGYIEVPLAEVIEKKTGEKRLAIIDGDTIRIVREGNVEGIRFKGANTTEFGKGPTLDSRLEGAEPGAIKAWEELKELLKQTNYQVYVRPERKDHYGRFVSQVYVKTPEGKFIDVEAFLVSRALGMIYFVQVVDQEAYLCYSMFQAEAQMAKRGLWGLPEFRDRNDPEGKKLKILLITSFHPKGAREGGDEEPLHNEYFRLVNTSDRPINLMNYRIYNKVSGNIITLPYFIVPPGRTLKVVTGGIKVRTNADPANELVLNLGMEEPFWENSKKEGGACLIIQDLEGHTIDSAAKYGYEGCE